MSVTDRRVLIVEDDYFIAQDMVKAVQELGAVVVGPAASIDDALALIESGGQLDLVLLDMELRSELALPVADRLLAESKAFALTTSYADEALPERYRTVPRLAKPVRREELLRLLDWLSAA